MQFRVDRGHSFNTYAQIYKFQTHPATLFAQIMMLLQRQHIGIRKALDADPFWCVRTKCMPPCEIAWAMA